MNLDKTSTFVSCARSSFFSFVMRIMIASCHNYEILNSVVIRFTVNMMNKFVGSKFSFHNFFHNDSMFKKLSLSSRNSKVDISFSMKSRFSPSFFFGNFSPPKFSSTLGGTCLTFKMFGKKFFMTNSAFNFCLADPCYFVCFFIEDAMSAPVFWFFHNLPPLFKDSVIVCNKYKGVNT